MKTNNTALDSARESVNKNQERFSYLGKTKRIVWNSKRSYKTI